MKIEHLLREVDEMASRIPKKKVAEPTATGPNLRVEPGGKTTDTKAQAPSFGQGTPASLKPLAVPGASSTPGATIQSTPGAQAPATTTEPEVAPKKGPGLLQRAGDAAQGLSNIIQKGAANASDNIPGVTNWAGNLAKNVAPGVNKVTGAVGDVVGKTGDAVSTAAKGLSRGVQGIGDLAGAVGGAVTTPLGAIAGGFKRGYQKTAGSPSTAAPSSSASAGAAPAAGAVSDQEFNDLIARVQKLEQLAKMRT